MKFDGKKLLDKIFEIGILIKSFFGFFEVLGGIFFAFSGQKIINNSLIYLTQSEVAEDPNDLFTNYLIKFGNSIALAPQVFAVVYLILHGVINIWLAISISKGKRKVYPVAMSVFSVFIIYQLYKYFNSHSLSLLLLTLFDMFFVYVIYLEYKKNK